MLKRDDFCYLKSIFVLSIVKINKTDYKILFVSNRYFENENYKGYFLDNFITKNEILFSIFNEKDFNKWYQVGVDSRGNVLCLYYKQRKIDFQTNSSRQLVTS